MNINLEETLTETRYINTPIDNQCCCDCYDNGNSFIYFIGGFEKPIAFLDTDVPVGFVNSITNVYNTITEEYQYNEIDGDGNIVTKTGTREVRVPVLDQDGNQVTRQKTWREYCKYNESLDGQEVLLHYLHVYPNGCRIKLSEDIESEQWRLWWNLVPLLTRSEFETLIKSNKYLDEEII